MKKFIFSAIAAIGLLLSPSCSDENEVLSGSDNEALVSFNVNLADGISTKTISDGKTVDKLYVKVYEYTNESSIGNYISGLDAEETVTNGSANVSFTLVKGKVYNFLFWAQKGETAPYTIDGETGKITVSYNSASCNDENRDAFYFVQKNYVVSDRTTPVTLTRPFAQLNFLTTEEDIKRAAAAGILNAGISGTATAFKTSVKIPGAATSLDPWTGKVSGYEPVTFAVNAAPFTVKKTSSTSRAIPADFEVTADAGNRITITPAEGTPTNYYVLATNYFLVNPSGTATETDGSAQFLFANNVELSVAESSYSGLAVPNIPVQRNHRTNIHGELLSVGGTISVNLEANFDGDNDKPQNN